MDLDHVSSFILTTCLIPSQLKLGYVNTAGLLPLLCCFLAYFAMQVIYARRKYKISPPETSGHPEFERTFRAQSHCTVRISTHGPLLRTVSLLCSYGESNAGAKLEIFTDLFGFQQAPDPVFHLSRCVL
ncbi:hypothetical protein Nmel_014028 [Mimus melanotis]